MNNPRLQNQSKEGGVKLKFDQFQRMDNHYHLVPHEMTSIPAETRQDS